MATYRHMYTNISLIIHTVVWENFGVQKFSSDVRYDENEHTKIFLPQRNRTVYDDL